MERSDGITSVESLRVTVRRHDAASVAVFVLLTVFTPAVSTPFWAPKAAALLVVAALGFTVTSVVWRSSLRVPMLAAAGFLVVATISTLLSDNPLLSLVGEFNHPGGLLFLVGMVGCWVLGAGAGTSESFTPAVIVAVVVNGVVAMLSLVLPTDLLPLSAEGRAVGLQGNPVHLGAVAAASTALVAYTWRKTPVLAIGFMVVVGMALQLSGTRVSLPLAGMGVVIGAFSLRGVARVALPLALAAGVLIGGAVPGESAGTAASATARIGGESSVPTARIETWLASRHAIADHPVLGSGPARFRAATSRYRTERVALAEQPDRVFQDAHNLVVEYAVTTGLVGVALAGVWIVTAATRAHGPVLLFAGLLLAHGLLEPQSVGTTVVAVMALGVASAKAAPPSRLRVSATVPAVAALLLGAILLGGTFQMRNASTDFSLGGATAADRTLGRVWPDPARLVARIARVEPGVPTVSLTRRWLIRARDRDPADPRAWLDLADFEQKEGRFPEAERYYAEALERDPWSARGHAGLGRLLIATNRPEDAIAHLERAIGLRRSREWLTLLDEAREAAHAREEGGP